MAIPLAEYTLREGSRNKIICSNSKGKDIFVLEPGNVLSNTLYLFQKIDVEDEIFEIRKESTFSNTLYAIFPGKEVRMIHSIDSNDFQFTIGSQLWEWSPVYEPTFQFQLDIEDAYVAHYTPENESNIFNGAIFIREGNMKLIEVMFGTIFLVLIYLNRINT